MFRFTYFRIILANLFLVPEILCCGPWILSLGKTDYIISPGLPSGIITAPRARDLVCCMNYSGSVLTQVNSRGLEDTVNRTSRYSKMVADKFLCSHSSKFKTPGPGFVRLRIATDPFIIILFDRTHNDVQATQSGRNRNSSVYIDNARTQDTAAGAHKTHCAS